MAACLLLTALLGGLFVVASGTYGHFRGRTVSLCVVTDFEYRKQRPEWQSWLQPVFAEVNRAFQKTGLQWKVSFGGEAYPPEAHGDMSERAALVEDTGCKADVVLGLTARPDRHVNSVSYPFAHTLLVENNSEETAAMTVTAIARSLAQLFGVPVAPRTFIVTDAEEGIFDSATLRLIRELRDYNFAEGPSAMPGRWENRAAQALTNFMNGKKPHPDAEAHRVLGTAFTAKCRYGDAVRNYREAVRLSPNDTGLHFALAIALQQDSETREAVAELRTVARLDPANAQPHAAAGAIFLNANRVEEAVGEFQQAVALEPRNASYQTAFGVALSRQAGGSRDAAAAFQAAVKLRPLEPGAMAGLASATNTGESLQHLAHILETTLQKNPNSPQSHLDAGVVRAQTGEFDAAQREFRRAIELQPSNGMAHLALARTYYMAERYTEAAAEIKAAQAAGTTPPTQMVENIQRKLGRETNK
jgi:cytochrome c-type biogenesis protein CcmH/NrfG